MSPDQAAPGPCQGQAATNETPSTKPMGGKHGDRTYEKFGNDLRTKLDSVCRMMFLNPNGIGKFADSTRSEEILGLIEKYNVDVFGMAELNIDWRTIPVKDTLFGRTDKRFPTRPAVSVAHNTTERKRQTSNQRGGTAVLAMDKLSLCKESVGQDGTRLGRWSWIRIKGKNNIHTRIVSVYFPNKPGSPTDRGTYNQQRDYFLSQGNNTCPQQQFWIDLKADISKWLEAGDQLIIGGDWNNHIRVVNRHLSPLGLTERVTQAHGLDNAPKTHIRGRDPIDGIFTTSTLQSIDCGYLPFKKGTSSDHRVIWVDFDMDAILGFQMDNIRMPKARRLLLKDPRIWKKYNHLLDTWETKHRLIERAEKILSEASYPITAEVHRKLEALDNVRVQGMIHAEKRCRKIRHGKHPWSPEFSRARRMVKLWAMMRDRKNHGSIGARTIVRLLIKLGLKIDLDMSLEDILAHLEKARKEYAKVKKNAKNLRESYLRELARALVDGDNSKIASKIKQLIHIEEQRRISRAIKFTTGKLFGQGTSRIIIPDGTGGNCEVTDKRQLEQEIIKENLRKYHRTESYCPLLHGQLLEDIGIFGDGPKVNEVLDGTYVCPPGTPEGTRLFLASLKRPNLTNRAKEKATRSNLDEFKQAWHRKKERSSSYGPLHYGHYKAACKHSRLGYMHYLLAEIFMQTGCYLDRHREGVDVMLLKAAGDYRIERLRTICLFEAEFNMNNDRVSKAGLASALEMGEIADEQYSRPCRSAIDHVVNRRLTFDYFQYCRLPYGICSCDLAGCYDRIVHAAASLALQRLGVPMSRIKGMFDTIQRLIKQVRTAYGDSDETYGGDEVEYPYLLPPQGVNQGNCNGPPVWSIISSTVFSVLRKEGYGVKFITAISHEIYHLCGFAYVDDTDLIQEGDTAFHVARDLQKALDTFATVMQATGQNLEPKKSWWYLIDFVWANGEWKFDSDGLRSDLIAFDTDGRQVSLKRLLHSQGTKMLGVHLAPDGNKKDQLAYLTGKAKDWADCIRVGHLGRVETKVALSTCIWKTILYPLPATSFTEAELNKVIWPILDAALPKLGICRTIATPLRYGPKRLGGLALVNLLMDQGVQKIVYLLDQPWKGTPTGKLLSANVQALSLDCGVVGPLLSQDCSPLRWSTVSDSWMRYTWQFMSDQGVTIHNLDFPHLSIQREGDVPLMSHIAQHVPALSTSELYKLNICRLYLRAVTLSDICDATGHHILPTVFPHGRQHPQRCFGLGYKWPRQPCPPTSFWLLWKHSILRTFCRSEDRALTSPLGDWIHTVSPQQPTWDWFCHYDGKGQALSLWHNSEGAWYLHPRAPHRSRRKSRFLPLGIPSSSVMDTRPSLVRVTVIPSDLSIVLTSASPYQVRYDTPPDTIDIDMSAAPVKEAFLYFLGKLEESKWLLHKFRFTGDLSLLLRDFVAGKAITVSDGTFSEYHHYAAAAWVIESADRSARIRGACMTPGIPSVHNAYRGELTGILGGSATIWALFQVARLRQMELSACDDHVVGCDGYSALQKCTLGNFERVTSKHKHFDLLAAIRGIWLDLPCSPFPVYVESHMDQYYPYYALTRLQKMNVDVDKAAKEFLSQYTGGQKGLPSGRFHFGLPSVRHHGVPLETEIHKSLLDSCNRHNILQYWKSNWKFSDRDWDTLALDPLERAFASCSESECTFMMKWLSRQINLGTRSSTQGRRRKGLIKFQCPRCKHWKDDVAHVFRCPRARPTVDLHLDSLQEFMQEKKTHPSLISGIVVCTQHWIRQSRTPPRTFLSSLPVPVQECLISQYTFGWLHFLNGHHLSCITDLQASYFEHISSRRCALKWHGQVIREIWRLADALYGERSDVLAATNAANDPDHPAFQPARTAALAELQCGLGSLPRLYHQYFRISSTSLLAKDVESLRKWLFVVRLNREACKDPLLVTDDDFSKDGQFRSWLTRL